MKVRIVYSEINQAHTVVHLSVSDAHWGVVKMTFNTPFEPWTEAGLVTAIADELKKIRQLEPSAKLIKILEGKTLDIPSDLEPMACE